MVNRSILHPVGKVNDDQLNILLQGVDVWNSWRNAHPDVPVQLSEVDLRPEAILEYPIYRESGASLREINLTGADLSHCHLEGADLYGARLEGACLLGANLEKAVLQAAHLSNAVLSAANFQGATFTYADLRGAILQGANLKNVSLHQTDFRDADLRGVKNAVYDESHIVHALTGLAANDPWSILRRKYTGFMALIHLFLLVMFISPYVGHAIFWQAVNQGQEIYSTKYKEIIVDLRKIEKRKLTASEQWRDSAIRELSTLKLNAESVNHIKNIIEDGYSIEVDGGKALVYSHLSDKLEKIGPCLSSQCVETPIWRLLLQFDKGVFPSLLVISLIFYNLLRGFITWRVSLMRDEEERSGLSPPWRSIRIRGRLRTWLPWAVIRKLPAFLERVSIRDSKYIQMGYYPIFQAHRIMTVMLWSIVATAITYNAWKLLTATVFLPIS